jgi:hypothetical protein
MIPATIVDAAFLPTSLGGLYGSTIVLASKNVKCVASSLKAKRNDFSLYMDK